MLVVRLNDADGFRPLTHASGVFMNSVDEHPATPAILNHGFDPLSDGQLTHTVEVPLCVIEGLYRSYYGLCILYTSIYCKNTQT